MADPTKRLADPRAREWTMEDIAAYWNVDVGTIRDYRYQTGRRPPGLPPLLPPHDRMIGRTPVWYPQTITGFKRPGRGHGGGPKRSRADAADSTGTRPRRTGAARGPS